GTMHGMGSLPDTRLRRWSMRFGTATALAVFLALGVPLVLNSWVTGAASALFMLATALVWAGVCTGLFALIVAIGLVVSIFSGDDDPDRESRKGVAQRLHRTSR